MNQIRYFLSIFKELASLSVPWRIPNSDVLYSSVQNCDSKNLLFQNIETLELTTPRPQSETDLKGLQELSNFIFIVKSLFGTNKVRMYVPTNEGLQKAELLTA